MKNNKQDEKDNRQKIFNRILGHVESNKRLYNVGLTMYSVYRTVRMVANPAVSVAMVVVPTVGSIIIGEVRNYRERKREENAQG